MLRAEIRRAITAAIRQKFGKVDIPDFSLAVPENPEHGDYATNVALLLAEILKKPPMEIASAVGGELKIKNKELRIETAGPGFINFWISEDALRSELQKVLKTGKKYGSGAKKKEKVSLDYLDANPTGPVHVGHARSGFLGDALAGVLEFSGYKVSREFYVNNAKNGTQVQSLGRTALGKGTEYKHEMLMRLLKKPGVKARIQRLGNESEAGFFLAGLIQKENEKFLKQKAKINFDLFFEEEWAYKNKFIEETLGALKKRGVIYSKDGATWFRARNFGDVEDRVLVRSTGEPTYVLPDIAYHLNRLVTRKFDRAIDIFGADHHGYGPRLKGALAALGVAPERTRIITTQIVRLLKHGKEFKMSKRRGLFVTLEELIDKVGLDAARYFFLEKSPDTHMDFDLDLASERSVKNPVYYIQYAHARIASIFAKIRNKSQVPIPLEAGQILNTAEELNLIKKLVQFPEVVEDAADDYQVHRLPRYAYELARAFHNFYEKRRVISEDKNLTAARLALVRAAQIVLVNTLELLGISAPKKM